GLSRALLMNDRRFPWIILVPERGGVREIHDLSIEDRAILMEEITLISTTLDGLFKPDKMNVGALGNIVPQLHIHVIARTSKDAAWPGPVWGFGKAEPYDAQALSDIKNRLMVQLQA
ncbi:MAG: HIT domain-containing protein, partial [Alphaproteobacteria bacterium]